MRLKAAIAFRWKHSIQLTRFIPRSIPQDFSQVVKSSIYRVFMTTTIFSNYSRFWARRNFSGNFEIAEDIIELIGDRSDRNLGLAINLAGSLQEVQPHLPSGMAGMIVKVFDNAMAIDCVVHRISVSKFSLPCIVARWYPIVSKS